MTRSRRNSARNANSDLLEKLDNKTGQWNFSKILRNFYHQRLFFYKPILKMYTGILLIKSKLESILYDMKAPEKGYSMMKFLKTFVETITISFLREISVFTDTENVFFFKLLPKYPFPTREMKSST